MREYTDEQVYHSADTDVNIFVKTYGESLDEDQKMALRAEIYPIALQEQLDTREAAAPYGVYSLEADDECRRIRHRAFRDKSAIAAKYGIDTGFEIISKNWDF